jgi:hypothetical protein
MRPDIGARARAHQHLVVLAIGVLVAAFAVDARRIVVVVRWGKEGDIAARVCHGEGALVVISLDLMACSHDFTVRFETTLSSRSRRLAYCVRLLYERGLQEV